jgi:signal transduction histidine kinase
VVWHRFGAGAVGEKKQVTAITTRAERHPLRSDVAEVALPAAPVSCRLAREFVLSVTGGPEDPRVALVVTELVTNAVIHGRARPVLRVAWDGAVVRIEVEDDGPGLPTLRPMSATTTSGRGLALVDQIADTWGIVEAEPDGPGRRKTVWATITLG